MFMRKIIFRSFAAGMLAFLFRGTASAQEKNLVVRVARIVIDSAQLDNYRAALKEGIEIAMKVEPGVLTFYAVYEKNNPTHVTILEVYASPEAYKSHLTTPHFLKYKSTTKDMVKSLELADAAPIELLSKMKQ
jgi:4-carboxymuconolactone decarboxylase